MGAHLVELRVGDGQAQLLLALGQRDPQPAPSRKLEVGGEDMLHLGRRVPGAQGIFIRGFIHFIPP